MSARSAFRPGDVVRTFRWAYSPVWDGKVLAIDGDILAVVDLSINLPHPQYPRGAHVVRGVWRDEVFLVKRAGR